MKRSFLTVLSALIALGYMGTGRPAQATPNDTYALDGAYCEYIPDEIDYPSAAMGCSFIQDERGVDILWADGVYNQFEASQLGMFIDQRGGIVAQVDAPGPQVRVFQMEAGSLIVYLR